MREDRTLTDTAELLRLLANPVRLAIVLDLAGRPMTVTELVGSVGASQSLVSQHLRLLRASRLVMDRRKGRQVVYSLVDEHVAHIAQDAQRHITEAV